MSVVPPGVMHPDSAGRCRFCWLFFPTSAQAVDHEETCRSKPAEDVDV